MNRAWNWHAPLYEPCGHYTCVDSLKICMQVAEVMF